MKLAIAVFLAVLAGAGCEGALPGRVTVQADTAAGEVPLRVAGRGGAVLLVGVHINGAGPYNLVLDTGATFTCIDDRLARELALPRKTGAVGLGAGVGGSGRVALVQVDSIRVGSSTVTNLTACVLDLRHLRDLGAGGVNGLLGLNFLTSFHVTLDFEQRLMTLSPK
ncbi:MAG TPA: retropepsin-like aspartic protease [Gemmatimonadaceae bacterium]|nr:retropepsin-like aspartic protease [Gemmatimonadaceae bacterium]